MSQFIPSMREWKALPDQDDRRMILEQLRNQVGDKALCITWDMTPNEYYSLLMRHKFSTKGVMENLGAPAVSKKEKPKLNPEQKEEAKVTEIEPEITSVEEAIQLLNPVEKRVPVRHKVQLPFPSLKGTPSQVMKQFEALALFLEAQEEEDARYEIHIAAVKL